MVSDSRRSVPAHMASRATLSAGYDWVARRVLEPGADGTGA